MASEGKGISLDSSVWEAVQAICESENRSLSNAVETLLKEAIQKRKEA